MPLAPAQATHTPARAKSSEPGLAEFRSALFTRRFEALKTWFLAASFAGAAMFALYCGRAAISPAQYADAAAAISTVRAKVEAGTNSAAESAHVRVVAVSLYARSALTRALASVRPPVSAPAEVIAKATPASIRLRRIPVRKRAAREFVRVSARRVAPPAARAVRRGHAVVMPAPADDAAVSSLSDQFSNWLINRFPAELSDECAKAYYGLLAFASGEIEMFGNQVESWMNWALDKLNLGNAVQSFDPSDPASMVRSAMGAGVVVVLAGLATFSLVLLAVAAPLKEAVRGVDGKMRTRRGWGIS